MSSIVLTGATSMIGIALIKRCITRGIRVTALIRLDTQRLDRLPDSNLIKIVKCSLDTLVNFDSTELGNDSQIFYHLGWSGTDQQGRFDCDIQLENIRHTLTAVRLAKRMGCKKFIGAGSQAEYGRALVPLADTTPVNPESSYGISKYAAGQLAKIECKRLGLGYTWVRVLSVYGVNDNEGTLLRDFIASCKENHPMSLGPCTHIWDYLYEDDAGSAFLAIGERGIDGKTYCLGSGVGRPLKEYLEMVRDMVNSTYLPQYGKIPYSEISLRYLCADISELVNDTGWKPEVSFEDGIRRMISENRATT